MARIIDDFGYRIKIPDEEFLALTLVDNGINPHKTMKKRSLHKKVIDEYKRRLVVNIAGFAKKSTKNRKFIQKKLKIKRKSCHILPNLAKKTDKNWIIRQLSRISLKKLDNVNKLILQHSRTKKNIIPKSRKTKKRRKR
jgi:N-glycosylase/DNA lyase